MLTFETVKLRPLLMFDRSADLELFSAKAALVFKISVLFLALRNGLDLFSTFRLGLGTEFVLPWLLDAAERGVPSARVGAGVDSVLEWPVPLGALVI